VPSYYYLVNDTSFLGLEKGPNWWWVRRRSQGARAGVISMKAERYIWATLSILFCLLGTGVLLDSIRHAGPYAEEYVLLGATLTALGLASLWILYEQYRQVRAMARHMRRGSHLSNRSGGDRRADNS
jgi:hypothetical protein